MNAEKFMDWVVETVLPREIQKLSKQMTDHQLAIEEKDAALALLSVDMQDRDTCIQVIEYENIGLQGEIRAKEQEIERLIP